MPSQITHLGAVFDFIALRGNVDLPGQVLEDLSRPGKDGLAFRKTGKRGDPFIMIGVRDFLDAVDCRDFVEGLKNKQGSLVTVEDDHGETFNEVALLAVRVLENVQITGAVGGKEENPTKLLTLELMMQCASGSLESI